jgi:hypothetical protein
MRTALIIAVIAGSWLLAAGPARAGLYNTAEPSEGPGPNKEGVVKPIPPGPYHGLLMDLRKIRAANPALPAALASSVGLMGSPFGQASVVVAPAMLSGIAQDRQRYDYLVKVEQLQAKKRSGQPNEQDLVNLSAYLIRLGQYEEAVQVLTPMAGRECRNFMIKSNLATAEQLAAPSDSARLMRAAEHISDALSLWPKEYPGLSSQQLGWLEQAEKAQQRLLRLRSRELRQQAAGAVRAAQGVDPLFGPLDNPVRFVGESGAYEAGKLAAAERAKLPPDAPALVQQLLVWMPEDDRLYWLYGELLNAQGAARPAHFVLDYCLGQRNYNVPELREHRRILDEALPPEVPPPAPPSVLPDRSKLLIVGGVGGLLIGAFVFLQLREMRRRRMGSSSASKSC